MKIGKWYICWVRPDYKVVGIGRPSKALLDEFGFLPDRPHSKGVDKAWQR